MDTVRTLGSLALGTRLRRISELLFDEVERVYVAKELNLSPRLFAALYHLALQEEVSVGNLATGLGFTHPAAIQTVKELEKARLVKTSSDPSDKRCTLISLSKAGRALVASAQPIWSAIREELDERILKAGPNFLENLDAFEGGLSQEPLSQNVLRRLTPTPAAPTRATATIEIVGWRDEYKKQFRDLNTEWLAEYGFAIEPKDESYFSDPRGTILSKGGAVFFAKLNKDVVGTCALLPRDEGIFELAKMGVTGSARGFGVGKKLSLAAIEHARARGESELLLETNSKLTSAIALYRSLGFKEIPAEAHYDRVDVVMKLRL